MDWIPGGKFIHDLAEARDAEAEEIQGSKAAENSFDREMPDMLSGDFFGVGKGKQGQADSIWGHDDAKMDSHVRQEFEHAADLAGDEPIGADRPPAEQEAYAHNNDAGEEDPPRVYVDTETGVHYQSPEDGQTEPEVTYPDGSQDHGQKAQRS